MKIKNLKCIPSSGREDDSFVGLKIIGNEVLFYYPEAYHFDPESETARNDIVSLLQTISLAKTKKSNEAQLYTKRVNETDFALSSYLWMIFDYINNGFYTNREVVLKTNQSGKVDWKRTMKSNPMISNGNVVYKDLIVRRKSDVDNLLVKIYKFCLKKSIDYIGWMYNINSSFLEKTLFNDSVKKMYVNAVKKELSSTFEDSKRVRLTHMLNVLNGLDASLEGKTFVYGVDRYHGVYERMIDLIYGSIDNKQDFNPVGQWHLVKYGYKTIDSSELRPDTILIKDKRVYVLDAKFYRFGFTGSSDDLPETTSIQKQITYGDFIKQNVIEGAEAVYNAFLLPYDKDNPENEKHGIKSDEILQYIGYAKSTWKDGSQEHETIHSFLVDLKHVVKAWNKRNHDDDVNVLIDAIDEKCKKSGQFLFFFDFEKES